jgi:hypothetical protein
MSVITRAMESPTVEVNRARRTVRAVVNTSDLDSHRTVVDPEGGHLDAYRRNNVVLFNHGQDPRYGSIPVGKAVEVGLVEYPARSGRKVLAAAVQFREDAESERIWQAYADESMRGFSVSFLSWRQSPPTPDDLRRRPDWGAAEMIYREWELKELSCCAVPSNSFALAYEVHRNLSATGTPPPVDGHRLQAEAKAAVAEVAAAEMLAEIERLKGQYSLSRWQTLVANKMERLRKAAEYAAAVAERYRR